MRKGKQTGRNSGSALVVALVIMLMVMMLSLALLLACYSLRMSAVRQRTLEQCKELAQSVSRELTAEITGEAYNFEDFAAVQKVLSGSIDEAKKKDYLLWSYLRCNLWQSSWPYYNEDEATHQAAAAYRYFTLEYDSSEVPPGEVTVAMYWESEQGNRKRPMMSYGDGTSEAYSAVTPFYIEVTCQIGNQKSTITSEYELLIETGKEGYNGSDQQGQKGVWSPTQGNPNGNSIFADEKWTFSFIERE